MRQYVEQNIEHSSLKFNADKYASINHKVNQPKNQFKEI